MDLWLESTRTALRALRGHRLRTALVALSIAIGSGGISLLVSLGESALETILTGVEAVGGARLMFLYERWDDPEKPTVYDDGITLEDVAQIRERVPGIARISFLNRVRRQLAVANGKQTEIDLAIGVEWLRFKNQRILHGVALPPDSERSDARVAVIAEHVARELFHEPREALGRSIAVWGHHYRVIGVAGGVPTAGFHMGGVDEEKAVYVSPYAAHVHEGVPDRADQVAIESDGTVSHDLQMRLMDAILMARHRVHDWDFFDMQPVLRKFELIFLALRLVIGLIAAVALFIAGAGVMNVLLASVRDRVGEIGIRRAVGATRADIRRQFLVESATLAALGGAAGALFGSLGAWGAGLLIGIVYPIWQIDISEPAAVAGVGMALMCGVVFGLVPARRAARLDVVACLRGEA